MSRATCCCNNFLSRHHCHLYQGYLFSRPLPAERLEALMGLR